MKEETIISVINDMNAKRKNAFTLKSLSGNVDLSIHTSIIDPNTTYQSRAGRTYRFYLIKDPKGKYVVAVYDMGGDLHWVVLPKQRRKGYLVKPLKEVIIPHLFRDQEEIKISIIKEIGKELFTASERIALKVGFVQINEDSEMREYIVKHGIPESN